MNKAFYFLLIVLLLLVVSVVHQNGKLKDELEAERSKPPAVQTVETPAPECVHTVIATVFDEQTNKAKKYVFPLPADEEIEWQTECGRFVFRAGIEK